MKRLLIPALGLTLAPLAVAAPAEADFSGVQNFQEWSGIDAGMRKAVVNENCNCSGAWDGVDGYSDSGDYWREMEYLHSGGFSLVIYRQADDGTWRAYWKRKWVDYDGPNYTVYY